MAGLGGLAALPTFAEAPVVPVGASLLEAAVPGPLLFAGLADPPVILGGPAFGPFAGGDTGFAIASKRLAMVFTRPSWNHVRQRFQLLVSDF